MKKTMVSLVTAAALAGTFSLGANASAAEVTVKKGDTLWNIAKANNITVEEIKEWNGLSGDIIHPQDQLKVALSERYKIEKGDTLWGISQNYEGVTYQKLAEWNSIANPDLIYAGDEITIYVDGQPKAVETPVKEEAPAEEPVTEDPAKEAPAEEPVTEEPAEEAPAEEPVTEEPAEEETAADPEVAQELTMTATAYTATCEGCSGITATGINLLKNPDMKVISVDPDVIPLGSKVWVEGYGEAIAGDTGGAIKGNKIDIFIPEYEDAIKYGLELEQGSSENKATLLSVEDYKGETIVFFEFNNALGVASVAESKNGFSLYRSGPYSGFEGDTPYSTMGFDIETKSGLEISILAGKAFDTNIQNVKLLGDGSERVLTITEKSRLFYAIHEEPFDSLEIIPIMDNH
jgi:3D (Asp-Asp-Asp) domain-containing protein/LysM repeat protein